jgi:hypothetical protein
MKVKVFLCYTTKVYMEMKVPLHTFLTSASDADKVV